MENAFILRSYQEISRRNYASTTCRVKMMINEIEIVFIFYFMIHRRNKFIQWLKLDCY